MPEEWKLCEKGEKKGPVAYALYKRLQIIDKDGASTTPVCILSNERRSPGLNLATSAANRQVSIIESLQRRGYSVHSFRKDIEQELKTAFRINEILCLAYEYSYGAPDRRYLLISVYAANKDSLLNVSIESSAASYDFIRKELYQIISSIR